MPNLFEKIYNYKLRNDLQTKTDLLLLSAHEKRWLKSCLQQPEATHFLTESTCKKLECYFAKTQVLNHSHIIEKIPSVSNPIPACFDNLRQAILLDATIRLNYMDSQQHIVSIAGLPYRLEYSLLIGEWVLLWQTCHAGEFLATITPLTSIMTSQFYDIDKPSHTFDWQAWETAQQRQLTLILCPDSYEERRRLLNALSCFEHKIKRDMQYQVFISYKAYEEPLILRKLCELGRKITVLEPPELRQQLKVIALAAFERYS